tara:strand:+ start:294 stop:542 length:249 start_codon:yes stop_codon:yes gene_type:complete
MAIKNSYKPLLDLRIYYVIALAIIFIWVPVDLIKNRGPFFVGYDWIWETNAIYKINFTFLALEFIFITVVFILFRKKQNKKE